MGVTSFAGQSQLMLLEIPKANYRREFIVDCQHGRTDTIVDNFPLHDPARASGIFEQLTAKHRAGILKTEGTVCECQPERNQASQQARRLLS
jgi:hypothetical protein